MATMKYMATNIPIRGKYCLQKLQFVHTEHFIYGTGKKRRNVFTWC